MCLVYGAHLKIYLLTGTIFAIVLICFGVFLFFKPSATTQTNANTNTPNTQSTNKWEIIENSGYSIFKSEELGFQVTLIESLAFNDVKKIKSGDGAEESVAIFLPIGGNVITPEVFKFEVKVRDIALLRTVQDWANNYYQETQTNITGISVADRKIIKINGIDAIRQKEILPGQYYRDVIYATRANKLFVIMIIARDENQYNQYSIGVNEFINNFSFLY